METRTFPDGKSLGDFHREKDYVSRNLGDMATQLGARKEEKSTNRTQVGKQRKQYLQKSWK